MHIDLSAEQAHDEAAAKARTGRTLGDWFGLLDQFGGPAKGRRAIGQHLLETYQLDPWWCTTIAVEYEAAHGIREKDGKPKGYMICATKSVKATPAQCFEAFASAAALDRWLGSGHRLDFREGGSLENADGNRASIRKINPGKTIRLVWDQHAVGSPVEAKFQPAGAKTTIMISHDRLQDRAHADGFRQAWGEALQRLKAVLEQAG